MTNPLLPSHVSPAMFAALCGRSARSVRAAVRRGEIAADTSGAWIRIPLHEASRVRGSEVTIHQFLTAAHQRRVRARRSTTTTTSTAPAVLQRRKGREE